MGRVLTMWQCAPSICGTQYQASRPALQFGYDWTGNLTGEFDGASGQINYARSVAGEVTSITNQSYSLSGSSGPASLVSNVQNGPNGPSGYALGNGLAANFTYDTLGRRNGLWLCSGSTQPGCTGGTQLYGGYITMRGSQVNEEIDTVLNQQINYGYDQFNRLTSRTVVGTPQNFTYSYDRYGNRWSQVVTAGGGPGFNQTFSPTTNQIPPGSGYSYDAAGNMTNDSFHSYTYDAEGNILTVDNGSTASYVYDALNRRARSSTSAASYEYLYDYAGRRTSSWLLNTPGGLFGFGNEGRIYWDGQQIAFRAQDGTTYFEQQNYLGSERLRTNYTGAVAGTYFSLPWGDGSTTTNGGTGANQDTYFFAGLDADTTGSGAQMTDHAQFRNYSFSQGRWLAPDPYDGSYDPTNPQSFNRYAYVGNNPLTFADPLGLVTPPQAVLPPLVWLNGTGGFEFGEGWDEFGVFDSVESDNGTFSYPSDVWNAEMANGYGGGVTDGTNGELLCANGTICGYTWSFLVGVDFPVDTMLNGQVSIQAPNNPGQKPDPTKQVQQCAHAGDADAAPHFANARTAPSSDDVTGGVILGVVGAAVTKNPWALVLTPLAVFRKNIGGFLNGVFDQSMSFQGCMAASGASPVVY